MSAMMQEMVSDVCEVGWLTEAQATAFLVLAAAELIPPYASVLFKNVCREVFETIDVEGSESWFQLIPQTLADLKAVMIANATYEK